MKDSAKVEVDASEVAAGLALAQQSVCKSEAAANDLAVTGSIAADVDTVDVDGSDMEQETSVHETAEADDDEESRLRDDLRQGAREGIEFSASKICTSLRRAREKVDKEHRACTEAWRGPLSLFDERAEQRARCSGVPDWAIRIVLKAQTLVPHASEIYDLIDVYESQVLTVLRDGGLVKNRPLLDLLERCDLEAARLHTHVDLLHKAREAFDNPMPDAGALATSPPVEHSASGSPLAQRSNDASKSSLGSPSSGGLGEAPVRIIGPKEKSSVMFGLLSFVMDSTLELAEAAGTAMGMSGDAPKSVSASHPHADAKGSASDNEYRKPSQGEH